MSTPPTRSPDLPEPSGPLDPDEFSPAFAAWALLLTVGLLVLLVMALWAVEDL